MTQTAMFAPVAFVQTFESGRSGAIITVDRSAAIRDEYATFYGVRVPTFRVDIRDASTGQVSVWYLTQDIIDGLAIDNDWREVNA
jgi:hypothetical protein